jgi:hypothetical protein
MQHQHKHAEPPLRTRNTLTSKATCALTIHRVAINAGEVPEDERPPIRPLRELGRVTLSPGAHGEQQEQHRTGGGGGGGGGKHGGCEPKLARIVVSCECVCVGTPVVTHASLR